MKSGGGKHKSGMGTTLMAASVKESRKKRKKKSLTSKKGK